MIKDSGNINKFDPKKLTLSELKIGQKPNYFWTAHINYNLGILMTWLCLRMGISARALTISAIVPVIIGTLGLFFIPFPVSVLLFGVGINLGYIIDCGDGSLARATRTASEVGAYLDEMIDCCVLAIIGVGYTLFVNQRFDGNLLITVCCISFFITRSLGYAALFLRFRFVREGGELSQNGIIRLLGHCIDTGLWWFLLPLLILTKYCWVPLILASILQAGNVVRQIGVAYKKTPTEPDSQNH